VRHLWQKESWRGGRRHPGDLQSAIFFLVWRCKNTRDRTPDSVGGEAGEAATPAFATDDWAHSTTVLGRFLEREEKAACIFFYVGGVNLRGSVFITAVPITKLFAWGKGDSGGHVLRETTSRGLCGLVCPSRTSERGGKGDCVKEGGGEEGERERERALGLLRCHSPRH
jgi:hypothetical protein